MAAQAESDLSGDRCRTVDGHLSAPPLGTLSRSKARVVKRQTRGTQNPLPSRACGFNSRPGHLAERHAAATI